MSFFGSICFAVVVAVLVSGLAKGNTPPVEASIVRGEVTPALTAKVVSVKPILRSRPAASGSSGEPMLDRLEPAVTGGSGLARHNRWTLVAQDDATALAAIGDDGAIDYLRLFAPVGGRDRFHPSMGNKNQKPDLEAIVRIRADAGVLRRLGAGAGTARSSEVLLLFGSGSIRGTRDRIAIVVPRDPLSGSTVRSFAATALYDKLRATRALTGPAGILNIEAVALVEGSKALRIYNRGNSGPESITASVDIPIRDLLEYLVAASRDPAAPFPVESRNPSRYDLGMSDRFAISISEAVALPARQELGGSGAILLAAIAEATANAVDDGATSGTAIGLQLAGNGRLLFAPVLQDGKPSSLKIEGLSVESIRATGRGRNRRLVMRVTGIVDSDSPDPHVPSDLIELEVTFAR